MGQKKRLPTNFHEMVLSIPIIKPMEPLGSTDSNFSNGILEGGGSSGFLFGIMIFEILICRNLSTIVTTFGLKLKIPNFQAIFEHSPFGAEVQKFRRKFPL